MKFLAIALLFLVFFLQINEAYSQSSKKKVGVSEFFGTGLNTDELVDKLVDVESKKGEKYQQEISNQTIRKAIINFVEANLKDLKDLAKSMYDYRSPFLSRVGISGDESIVRVIPNRGANVGEVRIRVEKMAKPDSFISDPLPIDSEIKPFKFTVSLGDKSFEIDFKGGKVRDLAKQMNEVAKDILTASVIRVDKDNEVLKIEGKKTGKNAKISINGDVSEFERIGLLTRERKVEKDKKELDVLKLFTAGTSFVVKEKETISKDLYFLVTPKTVFDISNNVSFLPLPKIVDVDIRLMESVKVSNVEVRGGSPITTFDILRDYVTNDFKFVILHFSDDSTFDITITPDRPFLKVDLSRFEGKEIVKITLRNANDLVRVTYNSLVIYDTVEKVEKLSEYEPKNYISRAENAVIFVDGVRIEREDNEITDVINGNIKIVGEDPKREVSARIDYDYFAITNSISNFIEKYNDVMIYLSKIMKPIVDRRQLYEKPDEEKEEGAFATDLELTRLRDRLRMFSMQPYQTRSTNVRLLYHIGIYTKNITTKLDFESDLWEYVRKGVLTIDGEVLLRKISEDVFVVADIFGYDANGDKMVDTGFAYNVASICDEYTRVNGVIANKKRQMDNIIKSNKEMYAKFQDRLEDYRVSLERKFGKLQQVLRESKSKQDWFNNQMKALRDKE